MPTVNAHNGRWSRVANTNILATGSLVRMKGRRSGNSLYLALLDDEAHQTTSSLGSNEFAELEFEKLDNQNYVCSPHPLEWSFAGPGKATYGKSKDIHFYTDSGSDWENNIELYWAMRVSPNDITLYLVSFTDDSVNISYTSGQTASIDIRAEKTDAVTNYNRLTDEVRLNRHIGRKENKIIFGDSAGTVFGIVDGGDPIFIKGINQYSDLNLVKSYTAPGCDLDQATLRIKAEDPQRVQIDRAPTNSVWAVSTDSSNVETLIIEGVEDPN